jgi:hypothetical protein
MEGEATSFHRQHPGLLVLQTSLIIAGIIVIVLSLSIPERCVFGVSSDNPRGIEGVCAFHSIVSFVGFLMAILVLIGARFMSSARDSFRLSEEAYFRAAVACFLTTCIWFLDACLLSGYFDLTCANVPRCRDVAGWHMGGWNITGAWCSVAVWIFACVVYAQLARKSPEGPTAKKFRDVEGQEDATWTVSQAEVVEESSPVPGHPQATAENVTLKCNDPSPFTIVIHGVKEDGRPGSVPSCEEVTIDGGVIHPRRYPAIIDALQRAIVPHQEDLAAVKRAIAIMENAHAAHSGLSSAALSDRDGRGGRDERKQSADGGRLSQERLRQELLEQRRANLALQRELEDRKAAERKEAEHITGRQRAQSEQEKEASQLLQQMVELEALQQKQHADQIAALERQIAQLKRGGGQSAAPQGKQVWDGD